MMKTELLMAFALLVACNPQKVEEPPQTKVRAESSHSSESRARATAGYQRLEKSEAGRILKRSIDYHGGLRAFFEGAALGFDYLYQPQAPGAMGKRSHQVVDVLKSRVYHDVSMPVEGQMAFDGKQAWGDFKKGDFPGVRFWNLTPYYFVAIPFVLADPGVNWVLLANEDPQKAGMGDAHVLKVTFDSGTGDAPDDYYIVYINKKSGRCEGIRYVVSYKPLVSAKGIKHTPEKLLVYTQEQTVGPLKLSAKHLTYTFAEGERKELVTTSTIRDLKYKASFNEARLKMPKGAKIDRALDTSP